MNELTKKEEDLLKSIDVSTKVKEEIKKVWLAGEYKYQREYTNILLLLMPMFIITFIVVTSSPELAAMKHIIGWAAWVLYFAIPTFIVLRLCILTLASHDRSVLLGHSSIYLWERPKIIKTIYTTVVSLLFIIILARAGLIITSVCLALTLIIIAFSTKTIRNKVQSVVDEIDRSNAAPIIIPTPSPAAI